MQIERNIRAGILTRCSDGVARPRSIVPMWEKRNHKDYKYLISKNAYKSDYLDNLSIQSIENLCIDFKAAEERKRIEYEEKRRIQSEIAEENDRRWRNPLNHILFEINDYNQSKGNVGVYLIYTS